MLFCKLIAVCVCTLTVHLQTASANIWADPDLELLDEVHDAEIYQAVVTSVEEWRRKRELKKLHSRIKRDDVQSVCYPEIGCFDSSGPFSYLDMLPSKPEEIGTKFLLYPGRSRGRSGTPPAEVPFHNISDAFDWAKQGFNNSLPTKVLIHGFGSGCTHIWVYEMRSALMAVEEINVICVDWENGATLPNYVKATANTRLVGKQLAMLLQGLVKHNGLSLQNTHLIGFSLGAHVAGFAGSEIGNLSRITGLDPAGPLFESQDPRARLDQNDAEFVDVIHSNGENLILGGLGSYQPMGHVDFYPNGGRMQKGCSNLFVGAVSDIIWSSAVEGRSLCNHRRAYKFFTDSVSPRCHFPAFPCNSYEDFLAGKCFPCTDERKCGNMGYYADRSKGRGQLYLITRDEEPFCAHQYHVKLETSTSPVNLVSYGKIQITLIGDSLLNETFVLTRKEDEEMVLGQSISKILVPHPILAEPTAIQVLYTAYSGWLSSGLTQWRMDKVTLSDSFGKISSVCKKNLVLDSGIPVTLPLYPGECNVPRDVYYEEGKNNVYESNDSHPSEASNFIPTQVVRAGEESAKNKNLPDRYSSMFRDAIDFLHIPWSRERENNLIDNEPNETGRALNARIIKISNETENVVREIVEPILKPQSVKNARSHDPNKEKPEITEPILRPTTTRTRSTKSDPIFKNDFISKLANDRKEIQYNFYDIEDEISWSPPRNMIIDEKNDKKKRQEGDVGNLGLNKLVSPPPGNPIEAIVTTVQFLPRRLARMFEQAEKYARETILPLVSTYTPKFLSEIIAPKPKAQPKYVPLAFDEEVQKTSASVKISVVEGKNQTGDEKNGKFDSSSNRTDANKLTTPYTHIQKIHRKGQKFEFVFPDIAFKPENKTETSRKARHDPSVDTKNSKVPAKGGEDSMKRSLEAKSEEDKGIYIDLPVFETTQKTKYIPLSFDSSNNDKN
ncbi:uncharacterized protein LOC123312811 [Coccinella septempunctata]|uniref:uncharacterized protein LOC123312811 n=1 Tax=Coccinella septempunctata TaxID=41139 RepID=UPI001D0728E5|nr:uncharacterized protein LOC123312811 [Coccinella septempunctata]XP_044753247.1 uncharacterized protein LOC123312811 [Coccinella septempunctata]